MISKEIVEQKTDEIMWVGWFLDLLKSYLWKLDVETFYAKEISRLSLLMSCVMQLGPEGLPMTMGFVKVLKQSFVKIAYELLKVDYDDERYSLHSLEVHSLECLPNQEIWRKNTYDIVFRGLAKVENKSEPDVLAYLPINLSMQITSVTLLSVYREFVSFVSDYGKRLEDYNNLKFTLIMLQNHIEGKAR